MDKVEAAAHHSPGEGQRTGTDKAVTRVSIGRKARKPGGVRGSRRLPARLLILCCGLGCVVVAAIIHFILELDVQRPAGVSTENAQTMNVTGAGGTTAGNIRTPKTVDAFRNRLVILLGLTITCFGAMAYLFVKRLLLPMNAVYSAARDMADGNLDVNVPCDGRDEIATLGRSINDIAANFQEVLLVTATRIGACRSAVEAIEQILDESERSAPNDRLHHEVQAVREELDSLAALIGSFEFYGARFDGKKVV